MAASKKQVERHIEGQLQCPYTKTKSDQLNRYVQNYWAMRAPCPLLTNPSQHFTVLSAYNIFPFFQSLDNLSWVLTRGDPTPHCNSPPSIGTPLQSKEIPQNPEICFASY